MIKNVIKNIIKVIICQYLIFIFLGLIGKLYERITNQFPNETTFWIYIFWFIFIVANMACGFLFFDANRKHFYLGPIFVFLLWSVAFIWAETFFSKIRIEGTPKNYIIMIRIIYFFIIPIMLAGSMYIGMLIKKRKIKKNIFFHKDAKRTEE